MGFPGSTKKPEELYHIIEHFAQGQRRIELFGEDHNIRAGWVTVGKGLTSSNFKPQVTFFLLLSWVSFTTVILCTKISMDCTVPACCTCAYQLMSWALPTPFDHHAAIND